MGVFDNLTRSPLLYEMRHPTNDPKDVRIETAVKHLRAIGAYDPSMDAKHHMSAVEVEECFQVLANQSLIKYLEPIII